MIQLAECFAWCMIQVTVFTSVAAIAYWLVGRQQADGNARLLAISFGVIAVLTFASVSPWPQWSVSNLWRTSNGESDTPSVADAPSLSIAEVSAFEAAAVAVNESTLNITPSPHEASEINYSNTSETMRWWLPIVWAAWAVAAIGAIRFLAGMAFVRRYRSSSVPIADSLVLQEFETLRAELGAPANVELCESPALGIAATIGWRRPLVLLPSIWRAWTNDERRAVLAHELAHVAQRHFPVWYASQLATVAHFYHPLVHWLGRRLRLEQELAADELAARTFGDARRYAAILAGLAIGRPHPAAIVGLGLFMSRPLLMRRIAMLREATEHRRPSRLVRASSVLLIATSAIAIAGLRATTAASGTDKSPGDGSTTTVEVDPVQVRFVAEEEVERTPQAEFVATSNPRDVTSLIQISRHPWTLPSRAGTQLNSDAEWQVYRQTQLAILQSLKQLQTAVRDPRIANLDLIKSQADPARWLNDHLEAGFINDSEIMYVRLNTSLGKPEELAKIVDSVVSAYMNDVVSDERHREQVARDILAKNYAKLSDEVTNKMDQYNDLAKELGVSNSTNASDAQTELMLREITDMLASKRELEQNLGELDANYQVEAMQRKEDSQESLEALRKVFQIKASILTQQIEEISKATAEKKEEFFHQSEQSVDLSVRAAELSQLQEIARQMSIDLERMDVESAMPERVRVIQWAM